MRHVGEEVGLRARQRQGRRRCARGGAETLADPAHHGRGLADDRTRRAHQPAVAVDQGVTRLGRACLPADDQHATPDAAAAIELVLLRHKADVGSP